MPQQGEDRFAGPLYTWWQGDSLPDLPNLAGFVATPVGEIDLLIRLTGRGAQEIDERVRGGHTPYVAFLHDEPVATGWSARCHAAIGELGIGFAIPKGNRYLWDFLTLAAWRGRGLYPRLLQAIVRAESGDANRFWIGHEPENHASGRGIVRAGFQEVGGVWITRNGMVFVPHGDVERATAGADLLRMPLRRDRSPRRP